jgi:hypothetical protein
LHRHKRRRLSTVGDAEDSSSIAISIATNPEKLDRTITTIASASTAVSEQESLSIWNQAARTKRISILLLRDLEMTHSQLLREIAVASIAASSTTLLLTVLAPTKNPTHGWGHAQGQGREMTLWSATSECCKLSVNSKLSLHRNRITRSLVY